MFYLYLYKINVSLFLIQASLLKKNPNHKIFSGTLAKLYSFVLIHDALNEIEERKKNRFQIQNTNKQLKVNCFFGWRFYLSGVKLLTSGRHKYHWV